MEEAELGTRAIEPSLSSLLLGPNTGPSTGRISGLGGGTPLARTLRSL